MSLSLPSDQDLQRSLGIHRVLEPRGSLPQPAWKLDNTPVAQAGETLVDVRALHIDSASFTQIASAYQRDERRIREHIWDIVAQRGKMHNPVTGSGGVLIGTVLELDERFAAMHRLAIGDNDCQPDLAKLASPLPGKYRDHSSRTLRSRGTWQGYFLSQQSPGEIAT